jgi:integrase
MGRRQFGTIRKLPSGRFQARYRDDAGNQIAAPQTFDTKTAASQWLAALQTDMERGAYADPTAGAVSFADWAEDWMGFKSGQRPATLARDRTAIYTHFNPLIGDLPVGRITPMDVRRVVQQMQEKGLAPKSVRTYVGTLQAIFTAAVDMDLIVKSPVRPRTLGLQPITRRERPTLSPEELYRLAGEVPDHCGALVLIAGVVGLRWGEAIGLRLVRCRPRGANAAGRAERRRGVGSGPHGARAEEQRQSSAVRHPAGAR